VRVKLVDAVTGGLLGSWSWTVIVKAYVPCDSGLPEMVCTEKFVPLILQVSPEGDE
jgi:hypothetical protein